MAMNMLISHRDAISAWVFIFIHVFAKICHGQPPIKKISPGQSLVNEVLHNAEVGLYKATNLHKDSSYEARISYPSTVPTDFVIKVIHADQSSSFKSRHLLDIEKTIFSTKENAEGYFIEITAHRTGFPWNSDRLKDPVVFNLVLETLHAGLSANSWKMVCCSIFLFVFTLTCLVPLAFKYVVSINAKYEHSS